MEKTILFCGVKGKLNTVTTEVTTVGVFRNIWYSVCLTVVRFCNTCWKLLIGPDWESSFTFTILED